MTRPRSPQAPIGLKGPWGEVVAKAPPGVLPHIAIDTAAAMTKSIRDAVEVRGGRFYHTWDSRHSPIGFPDIIGILPDGLIVAAEIKGWMPRSSRYDRPTLDQIAWLEAFGRVPGALAQLVYPWHVAELVEFLRRHGKGAPLVSP